MVRKKYPDSPTRAAELLRLALPMMSRQTAAPDPLSYAVWYEHVSGRNQALSAAIEKLTANGATLDADQVAELFDVHVMDIDAKTAQRVAQGFRTVLQDMAESAQKANTQTENFGDSLKQWSQAVEDGRIDDPHALQNMLEHTSGMHDAVGQLKSRLDASQTEIAKLRAEVDRARDEALVDSLTGLANRRSFDLRLAGCMALGAEPNCLLMVDIDHFKRVNDSYGHLFGDQVLKIVGKAVKACTEGEQLAARVGGEEFAVLLPGATAAQGQLVAEKIRLIIAGSRIRRRDKDETVGQVTASLGVAQRRAGEESDAWFERADQALYTAKQSGRNRVVLATL